MRLRLSAVLAVVAGLAAGLAPGGAVAELLPHSALYTIHLARVAQGTQLASARGVMYYRFADVCDAWTVETKVYLRLRYDETANEDLVQSSWSFASSESKDGRRYTFDVRQSRDGDVLEKLSGHADLTPGKGGEAVFDQPEHHTIKLPPGTLFPTAHLARLLDAAARGERMFTRVMFDGASLDNPYQVSAITAGRVGRSYAPTVMAATGATHLGPRPTGIAVPRVGLAKARAAGFKDTPAWLIRLAFFPMGVAGPRTKPAVMPEFEIESDYRADGVAERIVQDFGDFSLELLPVRIKRLKRPTC